MKKIGKFIKNNYIYIILIICIFAFLAIAEDVFEKEIMYMDVLAYKFFVEVLRTPVLTSFMNFITQFGSTVILIIIVLLLFIFIKNKRIPLCITSNLILITLINQAFKFIVQRPRPVGYGLIEQGGYSFPSGHSMVSTAFYGFLIYIIYKYIKNKKYRYLFYGLLTILILLIGISRIYLGVHYASDVVAGATISIAYLIIFVKAVNKFDIIGGDKNEKTN